MTQKKDELVNVKRDLIPEHLRQEKGNQQGMEDVKSDDLLLPRLGLCQALSPQRRKSDPAYIAGLEEGQLFNTVTGEIYGTEMEIIMLYFFKNRIKYFPIDEGGGIDCISINGTDGGRISPVGCASCKFSQWGNGFTDDEHGNDAPECTLYHNYMSVNEGVPLALSYKSTGIKLSKRLLATVRITNLPMYAKKYKISVVEMTAGNNKWFEKKIVPLGYVDELTLAEMKHTFEALKAMNIHIDTTGEADDASFDGATLDGKTEL